MRIMTILLEGYKFEKAVDANVAFAFNEFGEQLLEFVCYARDFYEFDREINSVIRHFKFKPTENLYEDDSWVLDMVNK